MLKHKIMFLIVAVSLLAAVISAEEVKMFLDSKTVTDVKSQLLVKYGDTQKFRIDRGVDRVASLWREGDGTAKEFEVFCNEAFIGFPDVLDKIFERIQRNFETLTGNLLAISLDFKRPLDLDWGELLPIDMIFGEYNPSAHLSDDFFNNKLAFMIGLNFPIYSLAEKTTLGPSWSRKDWAYARLGDYFTSRIPAEINQKVFSIFTRADSYISNYNIYMGNLVDSKGKTYFPADMKLIMHWGVRDELKARYADPEGLKKQEMVFAMMNRIIKQEIPAAMVDKKDFTWDPVKNKVYKNGKEVKAEAEPDTRYETFLSTFKAARLLDPYYPELNNHMKRKFEREREIPEAQVEKLFTELISSKTIKKVAKLIEKRLDRDLRPFDLWYTGFRAGSGGMNEEELDKIVAAKYPTIEAFQKDIPNILAKLGFSQEMADFIAPKILIEPARGAGHAWGAEARTEKSLLRTRVPKGGMNYKGFNIAMHELGHCVEQTLTLHKVDYYTLHGIPNTAFTEAFAYVFQERDMDILGVKVENPNAGHLKALNSVWQSYEIMGVALVDMKAWNWMYAHPDATPAELKQAVISIAKEIWNKYYAEIFGTKDEVILAVYSHMIDSGLYLPDYPLGHVIEYQIQQYLHGKILGPEMERMCSAGIIIPQLWMKNAVGSEISIDPMLKGAEEAVKVIKK